MIFLKFKLIGIQKSTHKFHICIIYRKAIYRPNSTKKCMRIFNRTCTFFRNSFTEKHNLRAYLNFPTKKYHQVISVFSSGLFSRFPSSDSLSSSYPPRKNRKISSKETLKPDLSKIETGSKKYKYNE